MSAHRHTQWNRRVEGNSHSTARTPPGVGYACGSADFHTHSGPHGYVWLIGWRVNGGGEGGGSRVLLLVGNKFSEF